MNLLTWADDSVIQASAAGSMALLAPAWREQLRAEGFAERASGRLGGDVAFELSVLLTRDGASFEARGRVVLAAADTAGNNGLADLRDDLQRALLAATLVVTSTAGGPPVGSTVTLAAPELRVRLDDGRLLLTGAQRFSLAAVEGGAAERLGFTQLAAEAAASTRPYAIDAPGTGSVVRIGQAGVAGGDITVSGAIRAHSGIVFTSGSGSGLLAVTLTPSGLLETLAGGMRLDPAGRFELRGELVARGSDADIVIAARDTLELHGSLTAQRDIVIAAGTRVAEGERSIATFGTSRLTTLDAGGRIVVDGLNDVHIDSRIGAGNPGLSLVQLTSRQGLLTVAAESGVVETGAAIEISGRDVRIEGRIGSLVATPVAFDDEVSVRASRDAWIGGDWALAGSVLLSAGDDLAIAGTTLRADAAGQRITLQAGDRLDIGDAARGDGAALLLADRRLEATAGGVLSVALGGTLMTAGEASRLQLSAHSLVLGGALRAGATLADGAASSAWRFSGREAVLEIEAVRDITVGDLAGGVGGELLATGRVDLRAGADAASGVSLRTAGLSTITADAAGLRGGVATWSGADERGDGRVQVQADGDVVLRGAVRALDAGSVVDIVSRSQVVIGGVVKAHSLVDVLGGTDTSRIGLLLERAGVADGGRVDTADGGRIRLAAIDSIVIEGVVGENDPLLGDAVLDIGRDGRVASVSVESAAGDVTLGRQINAGQEAVVLGGALHILAGAHVFALGDTSRVYIEARNELRAAGPEATAAGTTPRAIISSALLTHLAAPRMVVDGFIQATSDDGRVLLSGAQRVEIGGLIDAAGRLEVNVGVDIAWGRDRLEAPIAAGELRGGELLIRGSAVVRAGDTVVLRAGGDVVLDAAAVLDDGRDLQVQFTRTVVDSTEVFTGGTRRVADGTALVPEVTISETFVTEQVGTELVQVGREFVRYQVQLEQVGYYNPVTRQFRETLVEGVDYTNAAISAANAWGNASTEENPGQTVLPGEVPASDYRSAGYRGFQQLLENQRWAVLNFTGYKPLYDFSYSGATLVRNIDGVETTTPGYVPPWRDNPDRVYFVDVAGWRDKYVLMPEGAQEAILSITSGPPARFLVDDTTADGKNPTGAGNWVLGTELAGRRQGEFVGTPTTTTAAPAAGP